MSSDPKQSSGASSGITMSWPVFIMFIVGIAALIFWITRQAVDANEIGGSAGEAAAEKMKEEAGEIVQEAVIQTADAVLDRSGEVAGDVLGGVLGRSKDVPTETDGYPSADTGAVIQDTEEVVRDTIENTRSRVPNQGSDPKQSPQDSGGSIFDIFEQVKNEASDVITDFGVAAMPISVEEEWVYGKQIGDAYRKDLKIVRDETLQERIHNLALPILKQVRRTAGQGYRFTIFENDMVNAFALLGGEIFIATGLIEAMETDIAIQSVIAHEIAHVELGHCVKGSWSVIKSSEIVGDTVLAGAIQNVTHFISLGYSEDQELECDAYAFHAQYHYGISREDRSRFVEVLLELEHAHGIEHEESDNPFEAVIERHYQTHPPAKARVDQLKHLPDDPSKP